jgi:hypothetical protein
MRFAVLSRLWPWRDVRVRPGIVPHVIAREFPEYVKKFSNEAEAVSSQHRVKREQ